MLARLAERGENRSTEDATARGKAMQLCLNQFPAEHSELLLAPHRADISLVELAERRKKSPNALYKLLARLREQLTECIRLRLAEVQ